MNNEEKLRKINKDLKVIINEATFISNKCRNKIIKMLGNDFSVDLPLENFKSIDVVITEEGNIIMRDEEYKRDSKLSIDEIEKIFYEFKEFVVCFKVIIIVVIKFFNVKLAIVH